MCLHSILEHRHFEVVVCCVFWAWGLTLHYIDSWIAYEWYYKYFYRGRNSLDDAIESVSAVDRDSNDCKNSDLLVPSSVDWPRRDPEMLGEHFNTKSTFKQNVNIHETRQL